MKTRPRYLAALLALAFTTGCAPLLISGDKNLKYVNSAAEKYFGSVLLRGSSWSVMVVDLQDGRILHQKDPERALIPGSGMKLLVTGCALETLGPEYRVTTTLGYTGKLDASGTLNGDLVVLGNGDPTISTRFKEVSRRRKVTGELDSTDTFDAWVDSLAAHGIRKIKGGLIGSYGSFGGAPLGSGWEWDDLPNSYAAEFSPLVYADDCVEVMVTPADSIGKPAQIRYTPKVGGVNLNGTVVTVDQGSEADLSFDRTMGSNQIVIWGSVPVKSEPQRRWISVHDPANFFLSNLQAALERKGITVSGGTVATATWRSNNSDFKVLFADPSASLQNIISVVNKHSVNLYSEMLVRILGRHYQANHPEALAHDAFTSGRDRIREWELKMAGTASAAVMADGSGLSRQNLLSSSELIKVLVYMNRSQYRVDFINSLARPGEPGTLQYRFLGLPDGITLHGKTGSLSRVRSLSGYLARDGQPRVVFAAICNNSQGPQEEVDRTMDNLVQLFALYLKEK